MTQVGAPLQGEVLAARYRLDEVVWADPTSGHAFWQGTDSLLNRLVSIELRVPGGPAAAPMIAAAVTAGRIVHPGVIGVYDAVDEGAQAFVVREWVVGTTLLDALAEGPLHPTRAAVVARTAAEAVAAIHGLGTSHANLQPATVLVDDDGDVTLTELALDGTAGQRLDVRAIGALLYACLTGHWPDEVPPHGTGLPDALRVDGRLCSPRQVRAGIPGYLDALTMDLLDPSVAPPSAAELASELRRYDVADPELSALGVLTPDPPVRNARWKRAAVLVAGLVVILAAGLAFGTIGLPDFGNGNLPRAAKTPSRPSTAPLTAVTPLAARIVDDNGVSEGDRAPQKAIDGQPATSWRTDRYRDIDMRGLKKGIGLSLDLGSTRAVRTVTVQLATPGEVVELRTSAQDSSTSGGYTPVGTAQTATGTSVTFTLATPVQARYLLVWFTRLAPFKDGYAAVVSEISVQV